MAEDAHELVKELYDLWENLNQPRLLETWHDALQCREDALNLFNLGLIDLRTRAQVERLFWSVAREVYEMAEATKHAPILTRFLGDRPDFSHYADFPVERTAYKVGYNSGYYL